MYRALSSATEQEAPFARSTLFPEAAATSFVWHPDVTAEVATYTNRRVQIYSTKTACVPVNDDAHPSHLQLCGPSRQREHLKHRILYAWTPRTCEECGFWYQTLPSDNHVKSIPPSPTSTDLMLLC